MSTIVTDKNKARPILLAVLLVAITAAMLIPAWRCMGTGNWQTRGPFIDNVARAQRLEQLEQLGLFLPRRDGSWLLIRSEAGYKHGSWTIAVDSDGRWWETQAEDYELYNEVRLCGARSRRVAELEAELQKPGPSAEEQALLRDMLKTEQDSQAKLYPWQARQAATLDSARAILRARGFEEIPGLPRLKLAGTMTRPADGGAASIPATTGPAVP